MSPRCRPLTAFLLVAMATACQEAGLPSEHRPIATAISNADLSLTVLAQNVYVGTNVDAVLAAPPEELPEAIGQALNTFAATDWVDRAGAIAATIVASNVDVVVLNELTILSVEGLSPLLPELHVEFLPILLQQLAEQGGQYVVGALVANTDANLAFGPGRIRLQDFDAVLVRSDLPFTTIAETQYATHAPVTLGALGSFDLIRGYAAVELTVRGAPVRVVATHLEPIETAPILQAGQAQELIAWLDAQPIPTIVAGDLNSAATDPSPSSPYNQLRLAGFSDTWLERTGVKADPGYTCCHAEDLRNIESSLVKRIDHVMVRTAHPGRVVTQARLFGADPADRLPSGLWPSDHAGILARLRFAGIPGSPVS